MTGEDEDIETRTLKFQQPPLASGSIFQEPPLLLVLKYTNFWSPPSQPNNFFRAPISVVYIFSEFSPSISSSALVILNELSLITWMAEANQYTSNVYHTLSNSGHKKRGISGCSCWVRNVSFSLVQWVNVQASRLWLNASKLNYDFPSQCKQNWRAACLQQVGIQYFSSPVI